jgi:hypothetical protein
MAPPPGQNKIHLPVFGASMPVGVDALYALHIGADRKSRYALKNLRYVIGRNQPRAFKMSR